MSVMDQFPRLHFDGVQIAYSKIGTKGGLRVATHEYPHVKGGGQEALGRRLYTWSVDAIFDEQLLRYGDTYPNQLQQLLDKFETQKVGQLSLPHRVPFFARCVTWDSELNVRIRSGERVHLEFLEYMKDDLDVTLPNFKTAIVSLMTLVKIEAAPVVAEALVSPVKLDQTHALELSDILGKLNDAVNLMALPQNLVGLAGGILELYVTSVINLGKRAYDIALVQAPSGFGVAEALRKVILAANEAATDIASKQRKIRPWTVKATQGIQELSLDIYGTAKYVEELLNVNSLEDNSRILAGTKVYYYEAA